MSEALIHRNVAQEIADLAALANANCEGFAHQLYNSRTAFTAATATNVISFTAAENSAILITGIDIKTLYNTADAALPGDFRSTFDVNPYGPYVAAGAVGTIRVLINNQQYCATVFDIGIINAGILLVIDSGKTFSLEVNPNQPAGKNLTLVTRVNAYTVPQTVAHDLKKKQTQFITA